MKGPAEEARSSNKTFCPTLSLREDMMFWEQGLRDAGGRFGVPFLDLIWINRERGEKPMVRESGR